MRHNSYHTITTDVLVIGGGGAGLRAAIAARELGVEVVIVSSSRVGYGSNTTISGGGFAAVLQQVEGGSDSWQQHLEDTVVGGYFLSRQTLAETVTRGAERQYQDLARFGVSYQTAGAASWVALSLDPGHSRSRLIYSQSAFGTDFTFPLREYALGQGVEFLEGVLITRLLKDGGRVVGAMGIDGQGQGVVFLATAVILASGGLGRVYQRNDNVAGATGDGYALAYEAGAVLQDMEFVQFYPLGLRAGTPAVFYECLLLGTGGRLLNHNGEDIVAKYRIADPMRLTRDRLSLAIAQEVASGLGYQERVVLDLTEVETEKLAILQPLLPKTVFQGERRFLVAPTAHFHMGGVRINERAETSIPGLYAAGEVGGGVHGANRLSGNALTEIWVMGMVAGHEAAGRAKDTVRKELISDEVAGEMARIGRLISGKSGESVEPLRRSLQEVVWRQAGIIREAKGLEEAQRQLADLGSRYRDLSVAGGPELPSALRLGNMLTVSEMVLGLALYRKESRGAHYRRDYPEQNDNEWRCNVLLRQKNGEMSLSTELVSLSVIKGPARI